MRSYNVLGVELREETNWKCHLYVEVDDKYVYITKGMKEFVFDREELEKIFKEGCK